jgi:hypothetical protein
VRGLWVLRLAEFRPMILKTVGVMQDFAAEPATAGTVDTIINPRRESHRAKSNEEVNGGDP